MPDVGTTHRSGVVAAFTVAAFLGLGCGGGDQATDESANAGEPRAGVLDTKDETTREDWAFAASDVCLQYSPKLDAARRQNHNAKTREQQDRSERLVAEVWEGYSAALDALPRPGGDRLIRRYLAALRDQAHLFRAIQQVAVARDFEAAARLTERLDGPVKVWGPLQKRLDACPA